jgi:hypothetical protein
MWFLQVMRKVLSDGKEFLTKEVERVKKIQEGKITKEKKEREIDITSFFPTVVVPLRHQLLALCHLPSALPSSIVGLISSAVSPSVGHLEPVRTPLRAVTSSTIRSDVAHLEAICHSP